MNPYHVICSSLHWSDLCSPQVVLRFATAQFLAQVPSTRAKKCGRTRADLCQDTFVMSMLGAYVHCRLTWLEVKS